MGGEGLGKDFDTISNQPWVGAHTVFPSGVMSIGDILIDRVVYTDEAAVPTAEWVDADWFPSQGASVQVPPDAVPADLPAYAQDTFPGGRSANQAVAAAESGADTAYLSRTGVEAEPIIEEIADRGVWTHGIEQDDVVQGAAYIFLDEAGDNRITCVKPDGGLTTPDYLARADYGVMDAAYLLLNNGEDEELLDHIFVGLEELEQRPTVIFDPSPVAGAERYLASGLVDYATPNEAEYAALEDVLADSGASVIRTHAGGATVDDRYTMHAPDLDALGYDVVDTTAAGDTFNGYFAGGLSRGMDEVAAVEYAVHAASLSVTRKGAQPSIPARDEVRDLMQEAGLR